MKNKQKRRDIVVQITDSRLTDDAQSERGVDVSVEYTVKVDGEPSDLVPTDVSVMEVLANSLISQILTSGCSEAEKLERAFSCGLGLSESVAAELGVPPKLLKAPGGPVSATEELTPAQSKSLQLAIASSRNNLPRA